MQGWSIIIISELFSGPKLREGWLIAWLVWRSPFKCVYIFSNVITYYSGDLRATAPSRVTDAFSLSNTQLQKNPLVSSRSVQKKKNSQLVCSHFTFFLWRTWFVFSEERGLFGLFRAENNRQEKWQKRPVGCETSGRIQYICRRLSR